MEKINEFFINLLQLYVYIGIIVGMIVAYNMGWYALITFILCVPIVFGVILIQIDNNSLLKEIRDYAKPKTKGKTPQGKGDAISEMKKMQDEARKKHGQ